MADYSRQQDFSAKDALSSGDASKVIKGSEVDSEFDAILTSLQTKVDDGANSTLTSITGLTTPLTVAQGGTGAANYLATTNVWAAPQRGVVTDIGTQASTVTVNLDTSNNHKVVLSGNAAFASPTGLDADAIGQCGSIFITQDGSGSRAPTFNAAFDFPAGTAPTLTTTAAAVDRLDYIVVSATRLQCVVTLAYS
tara:strand:+ start:2769 stop:3353 length:585 start_codon:yes stop_codon:yes gene_type:complete